MATVYCQECGSEGAHTVIVEESAEWSFRLCNACEDALDGEGEKE